MRKLKAAYKGFEQAFVTEWEGIEQGLIDCLIRSMDSRVNTVLGVKGWHTHYWHLDFFYIHPKNVNLRLQCTIYSQLIQNPYILAVAEVICMWLTKIYG